MTWQHDAACLGDAKKRGHCDLFFEPAYEAAAKRVCEKCPVSYECLVYAVDNGIQEGIWGGMTINERERWRRRRRLARIR